MAITEEAYKDQLGFLNRLNDTELILMMRQAEARLEDEAVILQVARNLLEQRGVKCKDVAA